MATVAITTIVEARDVTREFHVGGALVRALRGINLSIAPGELVTLMGTLPGPAAGLSFPDVPVSPILAGAQLFFGGFAAPMLYVSATQINAIVPWEVAGQAQVPAVPGQSTCATPINRRARSSSVLQKASEAAPHPWAYRAKPPRRFPTTS